MTGRLHILVIDDYALLAEALRKILTLTGHRVVTALSGREGIDLFRKAQAEGDPFAVVLTDYSMTDLNGTDVAAAVKQISATVSVLLLTAYNVRSGDELPAYVDAILTKPPRIEELSAALTRCQPRSPS